MQVDSPSMIRNVAIAGHNDTGKTTLTSALLYTAGKTTRLNRVEDGNTTTDFDPEEIERGISIGLGVCSADWQQHKLNLLDCPGYGIFFSETRSALRAADAALLCVNAVAGVEVTSERVWKTTAELDLPVFLHLTKMDRERADAERVIERLQDRFDRMAIPVQFPIGKEHEFKGIVDLVSGQALMFEHDGDGKGSAAEIPEDIQDEVKQWRERLIEAVAESNDHLMESFFEHGTLSEEELRSGLVTAVRGRRLFPVTMGSASHGIGTSALLDHLVALAPSPLDRPPFPATTIGGEPTEVVPSTDGPMYALVFKTMNDPYSGRLSLMRVVSGALSSDSNVWNAQREESEKLGHLLSIEGKQTSGIDQLVTGDIGGVAKLKDVATGETLCDKAKPLSLGWILVPEAAISYAIEPKSKGDEEKIGDALHRLMDEDLTLKAGRDPDTGEFLISGTGALHVEIAVAKLKKRFGVEVILHPPKVPYRETIRAKAEGHGRHKKQSGGRGQFADCRIALEPLPRNEDFDFVDEIFGGAIPHQYRPAVEKGIREARRRGFLAGFPVVDFRVRLQDGQYHDVDSSELAFKIAGSLAFKDAMAKAKATILEPIMTVEISSSEEFTGDIISDLSQRRGRPQGMESRDGTQVIRAMVPMAEMLNYAPSLRSMTQGRATFHMEFASYEEVPRPVQEKLIAAAAERKQQEAED
ncbi:MAG TPA: elongation factor G [Thermoanaerobaculia bacterium]|nr:elongation factor G [Thermoanaerobaculia bacterium]